MKRLSHKECLRIEEVALSAPREWRLGQALYNALADINSLLASGLVATNLDPFYKDERAPAFLNHLEELSGYSWSSTSLLHKLKERHE